MKTLRVQWLIVQAVVQTVGQFLQVAFDVEQGVFCSNYTSELLKLVTYLQLIDVLYLSS